ncbi:MAG: hypothetical protein IKK57_06945 [Clostridia bacterium]|nr:hypothetical protein [Clostridia bacterium]
MDMQVVRESIRLEQPLGTGHAVAVVTGEVTLPGGLREETRVLAATASASAEGAEANAGRVNIRGRTVFHVLYTQGDPTKVNAVEASADFVQPCDLPGVQGRAAAVAAVNVQRVEARANGGRLSLKAEVEVAARATSVQPVEMVTGVEGADSVEVLAQTQTVCRTAAAGSRDVLLREEMALPDGLHIRETLFAQAWPVMEEATGGAGRVGLSGQVLLEAVHATDLPERPVVITRHSIPFAQGVEISGEDGEQLSGTVTVRDVAVASQADGDGMTLRAEVLLGLEARVDTVETLSVLQDAYTTEGDDLRLKSQELRCRTGSVQISAAETGKATLRMPETAPPVRTVLAAFVQPVLKQRENAAGRTTLEGTLDATLLYMTDQTEAPVSVRLSEPFRVTFASGVPEDALVTLAAMETEATPITSDRVELRCILRMEATAEEQQMVRLATDGQVVPPEEVTGDVVLCYPQPGERLWDIARRYRVPVEGVHALNPDLRGEPAAGQGVLVWRRAAK